jgi:hypothetical protein
MAHHASEWVAKIKTLAGRLWHQQEQHWTVPQADEAITHLLTLFAGELSYAPAFVLHASP